MTKSPDNIDYNELKELIRVNTSHDPGQAITIPGNDDSALHDFENVFFLELHNQHDRVNLFVKSKADEFRRRLRECGSVG
jgi:SPX domain protein involved in polyphosphate accumulation